MFVSLSTHPNPFPGMSLMERARDPLAECREKFVSTFGRSCLFWLPAQTLNFMWVPPQLRVVYIGGCALIWVNILCWVKRQNFALKAAALPTTAEEETGADGPNAALKRA